MSPEEFTIKDVVDASLRAIDANIYGLREQLIAVQQSSSREHAEVRGDLSEMRSRLERVPTDDEFTRFKTDVYDRLRALEGDLRERAGSARARSSMWAVVVGGSSIMGVVAGLVITLIRSFVPAA